ncbi:putative F-box protein CPR30-like [Capsicum annuum]|nr:putative F-box protein CPR30-like [Capsicum annuum]KAF3673824.1 putative F-box protein CPR30-like [Capsicum annuum]
MKHSEINMMDVDGTREIVSRLPVRQQATCAVSFTIQMCLEVLDGIDIRALLYIEASQSLALFGVYNYRDHTHQLWLWNPSTRESIVLPGPKFPPELFCTWGLGYDSVSDDYKIHKIDLKSRSEILTLKSGSWRLTNKYPTDILPALFCTDSLVYTEIPLPEQMLSIYNQTWGVSVLAEKLCAYARYMSQTFRFWVMKDYGIKESWTELFTIQVAGFLLVIPKYRFSDGDCYSAAEIWLFVLSLGHPKDHLDYVLNLIPLRKYLILLPWNPSARESIALPHPKSSSQKIYTCGLGCGLTIDDYNILKILLLLILWIEYSICVEGSGYATAQDIILPSS